MRAGILFVLVLLSGCVGPAVEPAATTEAWPLVLQDLPGLLPVETLAYDFGVMVATAPEVPEPSPVRIRGEAYVPEGDGPYPLVLLMHGNHFTCTIADARRSGGLAPCLDTPVTRSEPSYQGYRPLGEDLASRGVVVLSIDANDINDANRGYDLGAQQRAQLFLRTIDEVGASAWGSKVDLERVGLMGHSRGGDGAARAVTLDEGAHGIDAIFALAPSDFTRHQFSGVAFATLLPYCDGDMYDLEGAWMYDDARLLDGAGPLHQVLAMGANHNFYNTVWTFDDGDWGDDETECFAEAPGRPTLEEQHLGGVLYMSAFFRRYVADESSLDGFLRGDVLAPAAACAAILEGCASAFHVSYHPPAAQRLLLADGASAEASLVEGFTLFEPCTPSAASQGWSSTLEFTTWRLGLLRPAPEGGSCPHEPTTSTATMIASKWSGPSRARWDLPADAGDTSRFTHVSVRVGLEPDQPAAPRMTVTLVDEAGATASVVANDTSTALFLPPGSMDDVKKVTLNAVRIPTASFAGVDLARIVAVELSFEGEGATRIADVMLQG